MSSTKRLAEQWDKNPEAVILAVLAAFALYFAAAWFLMMGMGWLHNLDARVPDLGYWASMVAVLVWRLVRMSFPSRPS